MEEEKCCCHYKTKERSEKEYKDLIHRLNRIEGQIRGIKGMVEKDAYCSEILVQVAAANAAARRIWADIERRQQYSETVYSNGNELCSMQRPCRKGSF